MCRRAVLTVAIAVAVVTVMSCSRHGGEEVRYVSSPENADVEMTSQELVSNDSLIALRVAIYGDYLFAINVSQHQKRLFVYDTNTGEYAFNVNRGRGYGELNSASDMSLDASGPSISILDILQQKIVSYKISGLNTGAAGSEVNELRISQLPPVNAFCCAGGDVYASGNIPGVRYFRFGESGQMDTLATYSPSLSNKKFDRFLAEAYLGRLAVDDGAGRIAFACRYADQLEIFNPRTGNVLMVKGPEKFEPQYDIVPGGGGTLSHRKDEHVGYVDVKFSGKSVYVLYSGLRIGERGSSGGKEIREFSLDGKYIRRYVLDNRILSFDFGDNGSFYGSTEDGRILRIRKK